MEITMIIVLSDSESKPGLVVLVCSISDSDVIVLLDASLLSVVSVVSVQ